MRREPVLATLHCFAHLPLVLVALVGNNNVGSGAADVVQECFDDFELYTQPLPDGAHKYGMAVDLTPDAQGMMHAAERPGIGGAIDFDLISRKTEAVLRKSRWRRRHLNVSPQFFFIDYPKIAAMPAAAHAVAVHNTSSTSRAAGFNTGASASSAKASPPFRASTVSGT